MSDPAPAYLALTVHQPYAWAIIHGGKDVENRPWRTGHRGRLWIHAGLAVDRDAPRHARPGTDGELAHGVIVGYVTLHEITRGHHPSRWADPGRWRWCLRDPVALTRPVPCRGRLSVWAIPAGLHGALDAISGCVSLDSIRR